MKKSCCRMLIACLSMACGCQCLDDFDGTLRRSRFPEQYPDSHALFEKLDRADALGLLREALKPVEMSSWYPQSLKSSPSVTESGLQCIIGFYEVRSTPTGRFDTRGYWVRKTRVALPDHHDSIEWQTVEQVKVKEDYKSRPGWTFRVQGKWTKGPPCLSWFRDYSGNYSGDFVLFTVISEKQRDQVIAALFRLCPNIKEQFEW